MNLTFTQASVTCGHEGYMQIPESPYMRKDKSDIKPLSFSIGTCEGSQVLECSGHPNYSFGINILKKRYGNISPSITDADTWKLLNRTLPDDYISITLYSDKIFIEGVEYAREQKSEYEKGLIDEIKKRGVEGLMVKSITFDFRIFKDVNQKEIDALVTYFKGLGAIRIVNSTFQ